ncbi:alpha beta hydrolase [Micractinium conductrix]|uniref:Alpha beta hydrolase n=1 Tax=Micractinium conductrix TaxID=554055 RepID=A0A2P6VCY8_9CHLO|nr:alpha beta hydrolase [Micractinium conductrix]|eukprot:PSC71947.1 alpha beta hydrolase [Micractinium conductrix]
MEAVEHGARAGDVQATGTAAEVATEAAAASAAAAVEAAQAEAEEAEGEEEEEEEMNLLRYTALQHRVAQLQGMQIPSQLFQVQRQVSALEARLEAMGKLVEQSRAALAKAEAAFDKLGGGKWSPGKLLPGKDVRLATAAAAVEREHAEAQSRQQQKAEIVARLHEHSQRFMLWKGKERELQQAAQEVEQLEGSLFAALAALAAADDLADSQNNSHEQQNQQQQQQLVLVETLCVLDVDAYGAPSEGSGDRCELGSDVGSGADTGSGADAAVAAPAAAAQPQQTADAGREQQQEQEGQQQQAPDEPAGRRGLLLRVATSLLRRPRQGTAGGGEAQPGDGFGRWGRGHLLRVTAAKLKAASASGGAVEVADGGEEEQQGNGQRKWGRGRLLRITADKLRNAAEARRREREAGVQKVRGGMRGGGADKPPKIPLEVMYLFPEPACSFNPVIHCPPSTFLWPLNHRFMGKLHRLQTGPVLQAFYRFGPFRVDPERPSRLLPAVRGDAPPLFLLSGLGSTLISWGVPLLRALATSHEVIIMEYRGAGLSKCLNDDPWTYYNQAEAVLLLADALSIPRFNWLGWSSGGNTGLVLAALHGERLGRMASHAGMAGGPSTIVPPAYAMLDPAQSLSVGQTLALIFPPDNAADFRATCAAYIKAVYSMPGGITDQTVGPKAAQEQWAADQQFIHHDGRVWDALPGACTPCLLMNGDRDVLVPHENAARVAARVPCARLHTWRGWGHGIRDPAAFARVVTEFMLEG